MAGSKEVPRLGGKEIDSALIEDKRVAFPHDWTTNPTDRQA
jgi:hypothetical protein